MRILGIFNSYDQDFLRNILLKHNVAASENIILVSNFEQAQDFIINHLVNHLQHIDLVITADKLDNNHFHQHLIDWIRYSRLNYSAKNFKLKSLPTILYDNEVHSTDSYWHHFDAT